MSGLPPGFVLDDQHPQGLPEGFIIDKPKRGAVDRLLGLTGERYQTWPERLIREAAGVPQNLIGAAASAQPGTRDFTEAVVPAATEAAMLVSPTNAAIRAGDKLVPGVTRALRAEKPAVPSTQELMRIGAADKDLAVASKLEIAPMAVSEYSKKIQQELFENSAHPTQAGKTHELLRELENAPADARFTPANLQAFRENLQAIAQNFNPQFARDQRAATIAIKRLDEFLPQVGAKDTVAGAASGAPATREQLVARALEGKREAERVAELFGRGRGNMAAALRSNDITGALDKARTGILERAEGRAQAANSGRNIDNTIRSKIETLLEKPKDVSGLSAAEVAALEYAHNGGPGRNAARYVGNLLGGGGGMGQSLWGAIGAGGGAAAGGLPGAIAGAMIPAGVGAASKGVANLLAKRDLRAVDEMMRKRSPEYERRLANPEMSVVSPEQRAVILRLLLSGSSQQ